MEENAQKFIACDRAYRNNIRWAIWYFIALLICFYFYATGDYPTVWAIFAVLYGASLPYSIWKAAEWRRQREEYYKLVYDEIVENSNKVNDLKKTLNDVKKEYDL